MTAAVLAFAAGVLALQLSPALPAPGWLVALPLAGVALRLPALALPLAFVAGFLWAAGLAHLRLADRLDPALEGRDLEIVGVVAGLPAQGERGVRFEFDVEAAQVRLPKRILLVWYRSARHEEQPSVLAGAVHPGERWRLAVRLRRPHGHYNPHGFDYEAWLLERGIGATGYVRARGAALLLGSRGGFLDRIEQAREAVRDRFKRALGETPASGIQVVALSWGEPCAFGLSRD